MRKEEHIGTRYIMPAPKMQGLEDMYDQIWKCFVFARAYHTDCTPGYLQEVEKNILNRIDRFIDRSDLEYWSEGWEVINYVNVDAEANVMESATGISSYPGFIETLFRLHSKDYKDFEVIAKEYFETILELKYKDLKRAA